MSLTDVFDLDGITVHRRPFEHVLKDGFVRPSLYTALRTTFPVCGPSTGPTGYSCYRGDPEHEALRATVPAWRALIDATQSQAFVDLAVTLFRDALERGGCRIDLNRATYVPYVESRADKERRRIADVHHAPHELFVRTDIHQGPEGYARARHVDHRRRLMAMLLYVCDARENSMRGGELLLHRGRTTLLPWGDVVVRPQHNRMVAFPCHARSWHSVPEIRSQRAPRSFLQISVSSTVDLWDTPA